jgi:hypothetical protein
MSIRKEIFPPRVTEKRNAEIGKCCLKRRTREVHKSMLASLGLFLRQ